MSNVPAGERQPRLSVALIVRDAEAVLAETLASVQGLCGPGTRVLALKGRYPADELAQLPPGWRLQHARALRIPGLAAERHILSFVPLAL